ncbi:hypothetical protein C4587_01820 [Candidatus Parcubacteria bacterium]|nr:MAG: hypothetical protein C4587_01820 [Candidatus Parcubacteria bacterium]
MAKKTRKKSTKPPSKKQLAARKKFAAMARARAKAARGGKRKPARKKSVKKSRKVRVLTVRRNPVKHFIVVGKDRNDTFYYTGRAFDDAKYKAKRYLLESAALKVAQTFANKYATRGKKFGIMAI